MNHCANNCPVVTCDLILTLLFSIFHFLANTVCEDTEEVSLNEECALVRSSAVVAAIQLLEPFESLLRLQIVAVLQDSINTGQFTAVLDTGECAVDSGVRKQ